MKNDKMIKSRLTFRGFFYFFRSVENDREIFLVKLNLAKKFNHAKENKFFHNIENEIKRKAKTKIAWLLRSAQANRKRKKKKSKFCEWKRWYTEVITRDLKRKSKKRKNKTKKVFQLKIYSIHLLDMLVKCIFFSALFFFFLFIIFL